MALLTIAPQSGNKTRYDNINYTRKHFIKKFKKMSAITQHFNLFAMQHVIIRPVFQLSIIFFEVRVKNYWCVVE